MTSLKNITLDDKYTQTNDRLYMTGIQALVLLPMLQHQLDQRHGLNTAGFISGYRGSPLGGLDKELWKAKKHLQAHNVVFSPGLNEDLAATAVWGSQQVNMYKENLYDGVFSLWYGKGPGVDRSGDVLKHGNYNGTSRHGGVLIIAGDDHGAKSSTIPHQSEYAFMDAQIPVLHPAGIEDLIKFGLFGWAMSRYSGCWVSLKAITEVADSSASVDIDLNSYTFATPQDFIMPETGVHIRWPDTPLDQEYRLMRHKLYAALAFARANSINTIEIDSPTPRLGIVCCGKSYLDVRQALDDLGISDAQAADLGIRVLKVGMPWPLEEEIVHEFSIGLDEILVVEEKRAVIENQLKEQLYNWREDVRPRVVGKFDEHGDWILPSAGELTPARVARVIAKRLKRYGTTETIESRLKWLEEKEKSLENPKVSLQRIPYYCAGCPHNTSTVVPEGSRALAGIGCHYMVTWMNRKSDTFTQMGGEGVPWIGQAPFTSEKHIFANLGDGTYYHSGILAIRASVAANVNITYKILFNDAVAMTGGQPVDGPISVDKISRQVHGEGVSKIYIVSDDPSKYTDRSLFAKGATFHHRDDFDTIQKDARNIQGVSVIIYEQTCAAEKRRRRKRKQMIDPPERIFINPDVCEGCGDCGQKSNCVAIEPLETPLGRKRTINQSSCNKDYSCAKGFCPSFVTVHGGTLKKSQELSANSQPPEIPLPTLPTTEHPFGIIVTGIGGTGVVTIGALLGMAAHLDNKAVAVLDQIGLAQKNGAVMTHVRIADRKRDLHAVRIAAGGARTVLGFDILTAASYDVLSKVRRRATDAVINDHATMTAAFTTTPDLAFPSQESRDAIKKSMHTVDFIDATTQATQLFGDAIASNLYLLGYAWQKGLVPLSRDALLQAIQLNGVAIAFNKAAFEWGRVAAHNPALLPKRTEPESQPETLEAFITQRTHDLSVYHSAAYATEYTQMLHAFKTLPETVQSDALLRAVAEGLYKRMAIKDEYEVARMYSSPEFKAHLHQQFETAPKLSLHLAPPIFAQKTASGDPKKKAYGAWIFPILRIMAKWRHHRNTWLDPFRNTAERKLHLQILQEYQTNLHIILQTLCPENAEIALKLAKTTMQIKGYGSVLQKNHEKYHAIEQELRRKLSTSTENRTAAE